MGTRNATHTIAKLLEATDVVTFDATRDGIQVLLCAVQTPEPEIVIGGLPGREFMRQQPSGAATPNDVEDRMRDLAAPDATVVGQCPSEAATTDSAAQTQRP